jgi:hypothetical protein
LIPLTLPEVRRLLYRLVVRILAPPTAVLHWSALVCTGRTGRTGVGFIKPAPSALTIAADWLAHELLL